MRPTGLPAIGIDLKGRMPAGEQASAGRALGRLSDIGWGKRLRPMFTAQAPDTPVPNGVARTVVGVPAHWAKGPGGRAPGTEGVPPRSVGVVSVAPHTGPLLIQSLSARIAEIGRLPLLGSVEYSGEVPQSSRTNSAQQLNALYGVLTTQRPAGPCGNPAAQEVRTTGVLPLVPAVQG